MRPLAEARAIALANEPLTEFPALCPTAIPLAMPLMATAPVFLSPVVQWVSGPEVLDDKALVLALYPPVEPMTLSSFVLKDLDNIRISD
jgi:hypothetical protein